MRKIDIKDQLNHLPGDVLLAVALNDATPQRSRKAAVEIMVEHDFPQRYNGNLSSILAEVLSDQQAKHEVQDAVETALEVPLEKVKPIELHRGASKASVTTETL